jgi:hypothetical protein
MHTQKFIKSRKWIGKYKPIDRYFYIKDKKLNKKYDAKTKKSNLRGRNILNNSSNSSNIVFY